MEVWHLALYAAASLFALRSLTALMAQHRRVYGQKLVAEEQMRMAAEKRRKKIEKKKAAAKQADTAAA